MNTTIIENDKKEYVVTITAPNVYIKVTTYPELLVDALEKAKISAQSFRAGEPINLEISLYS